MASVDLCTLDQVKEYLNLKTDDQDHDTLLERLITSTSKRIENWCSRVLMAQTLTEKYNGNASSVLWLRSFPVSAVSAVSIDGTASTAFTFDEHSVVLTDGTFTKGFSNVSVTYTAGYTTAPEDIQEACIKIVSLAYKERDHLGHASKSLQTGTTTFVNDLPPDVKETLWAYRRVTPC